MRTGTVAFDIAISEDSVTDDFNEMSLDELDAVNGGVLEGFSPAAKQRYLLAFAKCVSFNDFMSNLS